MTELADGSWLITAAGRTLATDRARQAARCALALGAVAPQAHLALATGRGVLSAKLPVGEVVDRAAALLCAETETETGTGTGTGTGTDTGAASTTGTRTRAGGDAETDTGTTQVRAVQRPPVRIDAVTAGLLDARFDVRVGAGGFELFGERPRALAARALLGRVTPCLGRDRELAALLGLYEECVRDSVPRLGLVTGPPGIGKSRLCLELVERLRDGGAPPEVWAASGDPVGAGSPFGLVTQLVRHAAGLAGGERPRARRERLLARAARHLDGAAARRVAEFFGELVEAGFGDEQSVELAAARQSAVVMGDQILEAWLTFLGAECAAQPLVIVLEDLHWGDVPSVRALATALRVLEQAPLLVLCAARPEAARLFPTLWAHEP
ncbi:MAG: ATP-binding protein, partial [Polyangiaceae bacterium]